MKIILNGKDEDVTTGLTVAQLLTAKKINPANIIIEHNYALVEKGRWTEVSLKADDRLEILRLVGGG